MARNSAIIVVVFWGETCLPIWLKFVEWPRARQLSDFESLNTNSYHKLETAY